MVALVPADGLIAVSCAPYPNAVRSPGPDGRRVVTYAVKRARRPTCTRSTSRFRPDGARFTVVERGRRLGEVLLPLGGCHNVENALGVSRRPSARSAVTVEAYAAGFASFQGVKRRQEVRGEVAGVLVIDDFAHHPTAVRETILALRGR